jgi:hypothetical protein
VGLKISCKIVQKNPRLLISLTISISQSNDLHLSKQRSPSLKARYLSPLFSSISIFLIISLFMCFLNTISVFVIFSTFFFFVLLLQRFFFSPKSHCLFFPSLSNPINFVSFSKKNFSFSSLRLFFFSKSHSVSFSIFCFRSPLTVFFSQIAQCFFQLVYAKNLGAKFELGVREDKKKPSFFPLPHSPVPL